MVAATPLSLKSPWLQSHLGGDVEKLVEVVWFSRTSSGGGVFRIVVELHQRFILFLRLQTDVVFLTRSATSRPQPTTSGRLRKERQRRRAVDTDRKSVV